MRHVLIIIFRYLGSFGFNPLEFLGGIKGTLWYRADYFTIKKKQYNSDFSLSPDYPCMHDKKDNSGTASGHYYHQDLLIAQKIYKASPDRHIDIGSRVDGFVAHVASFREIEIFDIRSLESKSENIVFKQLDLMGEIPDEYIGCTNSLSCLHTLEHFGLGRYGDELDYDGHIKGFQQITKIVKSGGIFYFSTPISNRQRIEFNAHRVFSLSYLIEKMFDNHFEILSFSYVDDTGDLHKDIVLNNEQIQTTFHLNYGCGIFELKKL